MNRRQALSLLTAFPFAARVCAQTRPGPRHRVVPGISQSFLFEPRGTLQVWNSYPNDNPAAADYLGLGHNNPIEPFTLYSVPGLTNVVAAAAAGGCSFAVLADGQLLSWGWNSGSGRLGTTPLSVIEVTASWGPNSNKPVRPVTTFEAVDVSAEGDHVLALARDGNVYAWGKGDKGQLGIGPLPVINFKTHTAGAMTYVPFPVRVPGLTDVAAITAGRSHSLALLRDGTVRAWGSNGLGQVGDGTTTNRDTPTPVRGVRGAVAIAAGVVFSMALLSDGTVMQWGAKDYVTTPGPMPVRMPGVTNIRALAAGLGHAAAITDAGTVMSWGENQYHQLGRGVGAPSAPAVIKGFTGVQSIAARAATTIAVLASGRIMTWGGVRPWTRPDPISQANLSPTPIL
jgi:alpha-tubulin suppressor-like RCC1 family protein